MKYIISILITILTLPLSRAQVSSFVPTQIRIGTDLSHIGSSMLNANHRQFEINGDVDFHNYFFSLDYGISDWGFSKPDYTYQNRGGYYRMGFDYNFIRSSEHNNVIYFGLRYARTNFRESFAYSIDDPVYGYYRDETNNIERTGRWLEAVTGMKVNIWKGLYLGWTARFKFGKKVISPSSPAFSNFRIPGFGRSVQDSAWGLNYQIFYQIPIREKKVPETRASEAEN